MTKLNLRTPPQEMVETVMREGKIAEKRFIARMGGKKAYDRKQDRFLACAMKMQQSYIHDIMTFVLPSGNKWCVFEYTLYDAGFVHTRYMVFCYYMTKPYGGMYRYIHEMKINDNGEQVYLDRCFVFGSHFFERLHERGIYEWKGLETLAQFCVDNTSSTAYCTDKKCNKWDIRVHSSTTGKSAIGRGFRSSDNSVAYIKTVLADEQLTTRQRRDTSKQRGISDACYGMIDMNPDVVYGRQLARYQQAVEEGRMDEFVEEQNRRMARMSGMPAEELEKLSIYTTHISSIVGMLIGIDHAILHPQTQAALARVCHKTFLRTKKLTTLTTDELCMQTVLKDVKNVVGHTGKYFTDDEIYRKTAEYMRKLKEEYDKEKQK